MNKANKAMLHPPRTVGILGTEGNSTGEDNYGGGLVHPTNKVGI